jgi:hypothetical protein
MNGIDSSFVAARIYKRIFRDGKLDLNAVPYAVDAALRGLQEMGAEPSRWAAYVHVGA